MDPFIQQGERSMPSKLGEMIKKAIDDHKLTNAEFDKIMDEAEADGIIDAKEQSLLSQLHSLIADGTVKRVPE